MRVRMLARCELAVSMGVLVVRVVLMLVVMQHRFVGMNMRMLLGQVEPHPCRHQGAGDQQGQGHRLTAQQGQGRTKKRCH